ncbi:MAG: glycosyl transferase family 36, partial [Rhodanobacter sp.]
MSFSSRDTSRCLLSNGNYTVMLHASGSGFSRWRSQAVTRWREDPTTEPWGSYLLLRDEDSGVVWSATCQPLGTSAPDDAVTFAAGRASFSRRHHSVHTMLDIAVAADADVELRRLTVSNHGDRMRTLSVTSYAELVLGPAAADDAHPAFSKLFVQTQWDPTHALLLATRRKRDTHEPSVWAAQALQVQGRPVDGGCSYETDRARWLGRGRTVRDALAMQPEAKLSGTVGCVLDPVFSLRQRFTLGPRESITLLLWTRVADSRDGALELAGQLRDGDAGDALFAAAAQREEDVLQRLHIDAALAARFAQWMSALISIDPAQRAAADVLVLGRGGAPTLWAAGISGDRPIALLRIDGDGMPQVVNELLLAQHYWQGQHVAVDVVLLVGGGGAEAEALASVLEPLVDAQRKQLTADERAPKAEVFLLREDAIASGLRDGVMTVARVVI